MMRHKIERIKYIREIFGIITFFASGALWIYELGGKDQVKSQKEYASERMAKHADSLATLNFETQKAILYHQQIKSAKDSSSLAKILSDNEKFRQSLKLLGNKVLTRDEFLRFIDPYLSEKKNSNLIQYYVNLGENIK